MVASVTNGTLIPLAYCQGYVSDFRILDGYAVTSATPPTAPPDPTGTEFCLNFTNAAIFDSVGRNNLETVGNAQIDTSIVKHGTGSMEFDGTGDWLICNEPADHFYFGSADFTIEAWVYTTNNARSFQVICLQSDTSESDINTPIQVRLETSGVNAFCRDSSSLIGQCQSGTGFISSNTWHHIAYVRNGSSFVLYIDGVSRGTATSSATQKNATGRMMIGARGDGANYFLGFIDDLRITKGVARYTANFTPPGPLF